MTDKAGLLRPGTHYGTGCTWIDYDGDGNLDLFVCHYATLDLKKVPPAGKDPACNWKGIPVYCGPAGLPDEPGYGLTAVAADFDGDGWRRRHADSYQNNGKGYFRDATIGAGLGVETRFVGWSAGIADLDNDGLPDLFFTTGMVYPEVERKFPDYAYKTRNVFRNLGAKFEELLAKLVPQCSKLIAAVDWRLAISITRRSGHTDSQSEGAAVAVAQRYGETLALAEGVAHRFGIKPKRDRERVIAYYYGRKQVQSVMAQSSYLSVNDRRLHYGLGHAESAGLEIWWPSGRQEKIASVEADQLIVIRQGSGVVRSDGFRNRAAKP